MYKRINPTHSEGIDGDVMERMLADVRGHIWEFVRGKGNNFDKLAREAGVSCSTVSKLAYGGTTSPHMRTVIRVMDALGKSDPILEAFKAEKPVSLNEAKARKTTRARLKAQRKAKVHPHRTEKPTRASTRRGEKTLH